MTAKGNLICEAYGNYQHPVSKKLSVALLLSMCYHVSPFLLFSLSLTLNVTECPKSVEHLFNCKLYWKLSAFIWSMAPNHPNQQIEWLIVFSKREKTRIFIHPLFPKRDVIGWMHVPMFDNYVTELVDENDNDI